MKPAVVSAFALFLAACTSGPNLPSYGVVPEFELTDQTGQPFRNNQQLRGKIWVANFIFTTCAGPCPRMTAQFRKIRDEARSSGDFHLVSFTVDPERDTPPALAEYGKRFNADPNTWHFLTGTKPELQKLSRDTFMLGDIDGALMHSTRFVLIDRKSRIRGFYDSSDPEKIRELQSDINKLLEETV